MQPPERSDAPNRDGNPAGHQRQDALVQEDPSAAHVADVDQRCALVSSSTATEAQVTNVTATTTPSVFVRDNQSILAWVLVQPAAGFVIEGHVEGFAHQSGRAAAELGDIASERLGRELHAFGHGQVRVEGLGEIRDGEAILDGVHR